MTKQKNLLPGAWITVLVSCASAVFLLALWQTQMIPARYLVILSVVLLVLVVIVYRLVRSRKNIRRFLTGVCMASLLMGTYALGMTAVYELTSTLNKIINFGPAIAEVKVFVTEDDPAESLNDAADYTYGILLSLDRTHTDKAIENINKELNTSIKTRAYDSVMDLVDSLESGKTEAIILNTAFLSLLEEQEGYADIMDRIREINVEHIKVETSSQPEEIVRPEDDDGIYTIFISGIDTRGASMIVNSRSDVNIIATVNVNTKEVLLVTTPRDYFVPLSISGGQPDKLTHAGLYGINVCIDTHEMLYDTEIDYYFRVNFSGFVDIINALGGIDVYNPVAFSRHGYKFVAGMNHVDGGGALAFARERYAYVDGDIQRGKNQQEVIRAVIEKMTTSTAMLTNFGSLLNGVEGSFETTIPYSIIASVVYDQLKTMDSWTIHTYSVSGTAAYRIPYSMNSKQFVWLPNNASITAAKQKMETIRSGGTLVEPETSSKGGKK